MNFHLGIDGGGSHTRAALVAETGQVCGIGIAGPCNYHNVGLETAVANLLEAVRVAWTQADIAPQPAASAFLGLAGIKSARDVATMTAAAEAANFAPAGKITVANDLHNALAGGVDGDPGIALIAGTGCNCLGRDARGKTFICGGWGWLLGDLGAGFGIAAEGLRAAVRAADGRTPGTRLLSASLAFFGIVEADELLARLHSGPWQPGEVAEFAPVVMRLANDGDPAAQAVLAAGAEQLAMIVSATARALDFPNGPDVVLLGGCITGSPSYRVLVSQAILRSCPAARLREPAHDPLYGAAHNALRSAACLPDAPLVFPSKPLR